MSWNPLTYKSSHEIWENLIVVLRWNWSQINIPTHCKEKQSFLKEICLGCLNYLAILERKTYKINKNLCMNFFTIYRLKAFSICKSNGQWPINCWMTKTNQFLTYYFYCMWEKWLVTAKNVSYHIIFHIL